MLIWPRPQISRSLIPVFTPVTPGVLHESTAPAGHRAAYQGEPAKALHATAHRSTGAEPQSRRTRFNFGTATTPGGFHEPSAVHDRTRSPPCLSGLSSRITVAAHASTASALVCRPAPAARSFPRAARRAARTFPRSLTQPSCYPARTNSLHPPTSKRR